MRTSEEIRERLKAWEAATEQFSPVVRQSRWTGWLPSELKWVLGEDKGALRRIVWAVLVGELHDAECGMRTEGLDLVLEGSGRPADFRHPRTFRFWLRLVRGQFEDMRLSPQPIQKIWILYDENRSDDRFGFSAQDNTLSGAIVFSCEEFEFRMWDHVNLPAKK